MMTLHLMMMVLHLMMMVISMIHLGVTLRLPAPLVPLEPLQTLRLKGKVVESLLLLMKEGQLPQLGVQQLVLLLLQRWLEGQYPKVLTSKKS